MSGADPLSMKLKISQVKAEGLANTSGDVRCTFVIVDDMEHQISREKKHSSYSSHKVNPSWPG